MQDVTAVLEFGGLAWGVASWWERTPAPPLLTTLLAQVAAAHGSALRAQAALQRRLLRTVIARPLPVTAAEAAFKPLARSRRAALDHADLARLAAGEIAAVLGAEYDQQGHNAHLRLAADGDLRLTGVSEIDVGGGRAGLGRLRAACRQGETDLLAAARQAAEVLALHLGMHLCFADAELVSEGPQDPIAPVGEELALVLEVTDRDLLPRPWLTADVEVHAGGRVVAGIQGLKASVRERPGMPVGPGHAGAVATFLGRFNRRGEPALLSEFHMAHLARGDQGIALGPEFDRFRNRRATRVPSGELLLVDRVMAMQGRRGDLSGGASHQTEYDSPADAWYYRDSANATMPNCVLMETSLQSALLLGYYLGPTLTDPDQDYSVRNLGGSATLLREIDLHDLTIRQHSELLSTTLLPGSMLQSFAYTLDVDGDPLYRGESQFGYFSAQALANQSGLDAGGHVPTWLQTQHPTPPTRTIDIAARRAGGRRPRCSTGHLALLDEVQVVDDGGRAGLGYLHAVLPVDPGAWYFARHFHLDPVVPGSIGIETVIQAVQEWLADSRHVEGLRDAEFVLPVGAVLTWKYRGQVLPSDSATTIEAHITAIQRRPGRVRALADASLWNRDLRIYQLDGVAVELREPGAPLWPC